MKEYKCEDILHKKQFEMQFIIRFDFIEDFVAETDFVRVLYAAAVVNFRNVCPENCTLAHWAWSGSCVKFCTG